jgi:hypothetical protein
MTTRSRRWRRPAAGSAGQKPFTSAGWALPASTIELARVVLPVVRPDPLNTMDASKNDKPRPPDVIGSSEYRARLMTKLNCLIAVLEVAIGKIAKSMDLPGANEERLLKIRSNLENTLAICHRAKHTLEKTSGTRRELTLRAADRTKMSARDYVELTSIDEYRKFKKMLPIQKTDMSEMDIDDLTRRLLEP